MRKFLRDTIYQTYGIPPEVLGIIENSNRATADAAMYIYGILVLTPRLNKMRESPQPIPGAAVRRPVARG